MHQRYGVTLLVAVLIAVCCLAALAFAASMAQAAPRPEVVYGTITNGETGSPIVDASVELLDGADGRPVDGPVKSDKRGGFSLKAPRPGEYVVSVKHDAYEPLTKQVPVGLDPLPELALELNEIHVIDVPPDPPATGETSEGSLLATLLGTVLSALAVGLLLIVGAAKSRDLRMHN